MAHKRSFPVTLGPNAPTGQSGLQGLSWQATNPATGFLPLNSNTNERGSVPSGAITGAMASTNVIYSQIINTQLIDNIGLEVNMNVTGNATGTLQIMGSNSGVNFYPLTFSPVLTQPTGSALGYLIDLNQFPFQYLMLQYTNSSGTGTMTAYLQARDI